MKEIIEVFRMDEIDPKIRARIIIQLGKAINNQCCMNITEAIVYELVRLLDQDNEILKNEHYIKFWKQ